MCKTVEQFLKLSVVLVLNLIMGHYSIKELEQLSGVKAHTIRIWEKRYKLLDPVRSQTNIRAYGDQELRFLLNVSLLTNHGYKISKISKMSRKEVNAELKRLLLDSNVDTLSMGERINGLILAMLELDEDQFNQVYNKAKQEMKFETLVVDMFFPFLRKVGIMWGIEQTNPAQEHFISNLIRRKVLAEIDKIPFPDKDAPSFVLFLREGELHEIALILTDFILRSRGYHTFYLGQNVPIGDLIKTIDACKPQALITFFVKPFSENGQSNYLNEIQSRCELPLFYNSYDVDSIHSVQVENTHFVADIQSLLKKATSIK